MIFRRPWVTVAAAWVAAFAGLTAWLAGTRLEVLREQLKHWQFWSLELCVVLGLVVGVVIVRDMARELDRWDLARMVGLALLALCLTLFVAPRTNRIYYDEQIYQSIGQNLTDLRLAQMCNDGTVEYGRLQCWGGEYNKQPYGYPHLLSFAYRLFGVDATKAFVVNAIVMVLTVCAVYLATFLLFADRAAAFFSGLIVALTPQQLLWSATAAVEPSASLACVTALLTAAYFCRSRSTAALIAACVATVYAVQFRPESFLIVPIVAVLLWQRAGDEFSRARLWWVGLLALALAAVHVGHLVAVRNEGWGTADARLSLRYVEDNLRVNGAFFLGDERFPIAFSLLAVVGLLRPAFAVERFAVLLYFLMFFGIHLLFYAGSYNYGADVRYSLLTYPPIAILGGVGAAQVAKRLDGYQPAGLTLSAVTAALLFQFLWYVPLIRATTEEAWAARADVRFAESLVPALRGNSYVLTHNPGMFHVWGVNAGQMSLANNNPTYLDYLATRYTNGVYLHWNFWCNVQMAVQQEFCQRVREVKPVVSIREYRERDQLFVLYRFATDPDLGKRK